MVVIPLKPFPGGQLFELFFYSSNLGCYSIKFSSVAELNARMAAVDWPNWSIYLIVLKSHTGHQLAVASLAESEYWDFNIFLQFIQRIGVK